MFVEKIVFDFSSKIASNWNVFATRSPHLMGTILLEKENETIQEFFVEFQFRLGTKAISNNDVRLTIEKSPYFTNVAHKSVRNQKGNTS